MDVPKLCLLYVIMCPGIIYVCHSRGVFHSNCWIHRFMLRVTVTFWISHAGDMNAISCVEVLALDLWLCSQKWLVKHMSLSGKFGAESCFWTYVLVICVYMGYISTRAIGAVWLSKKIQPELWYCWYILISMYDLVAKCVTWRIWVHKSCLCYQLTVA
jgi:hypothetical protein